MGSNCYDNDYEHLLDLQGEQLKELNILKKRITKNTRILNCSVNNTMYDTMDGKYECKMDKKLKKDREDFIIKRHIHNCKNIKKDVGKSKVRKPPKSKRKCSIKIAAMKDSVMFHKSKNQKKRKEKVPKEISLKPSKFTCQYKMGDGDKNISSHNSSHFLTTLSPTRRSSKKETTKMRNQQYEVTSEDELSPQRNSKTKSKSKKKITKTLSKQINYAGMLCNAYNLTNNSSSLHQFNESAIQQSDNLQFLEHNSGVKSFTTDTNKYGVMDTCKHGYHSLGMQMDQPHNHNADFYHTNNLEMHTNHNRSINPIHVSSNNMNTDAPSVIPVSQYTHNHHGYNGHFPLVTSTGNDWQHHQCSKNSPQAQQIEQPSQFIYQPMQCACHSNCLSRGHANKNAIYGGTPKCHHHSGSCKGTVDQNKFSATNPSDHTHTKHHQHGNNSQQKGCHSSCKHAMPSRERDNTTSKHPSVFQTPAFPKYDQDDKTNTVYPEHLAHLPQKQEIQSHDASINHREIHLSSAQHSNAYPSQYIPDKMAPEQGQIVNESTKFNQVPAKNQVLLPKEKVESKTCDMEMSESEYEYTGFIPMNEQKTPTSHDSLKHSKLYQ